MGWGRASYGRVTGQLTVGGRPGNLWFSWSQGGPLGWSSNDPCYSIVFNWVIQPPTSRCLAASINQTAHFSSIPGLQMTWGTPDHCTGGLRETEIMGTRNIVFLMCFFGVIRDPIWEAHQLNLMTTSQLEACETSSKIQILSCNLI